MSLQRSTDLPLSRERRGSMFTLPRSSLQTAGTPLLTPEYFNDPADPDAEAWDVEIERRIAAIENGSVRLEPWTDVKRRIEKEILGR